MRKIFVIFVLIIVCAFCSLIITKSDKISPVFNEKINGYDVYLLDTSRENINTNNVSNYFDNIKILEIYPYINPIYKKIINISKYSFNTVLSNKKNISLFVNEYLNLLENNSLKEEIVKYSINGIKINKIKLYSSNKDINNILRNYNIKIIK